MKIKHSILATVLLPIAFSCFTEDTPIPRPIEFSGRVTITETTDGLLFRIKTNIDPKYYQFDGLSAVFTDGTSLSLNSYQIKEVKTDNELFIVNCGKIAIINKSIMKAGVELINTKKSINELYKYNW